MCVSNTGDLKLYKELGPVRSSLFSRYQSLVLSTDPLSRFALRDGNEDEIQSNVMSLVGEFMTLFSEMYKSFTSEGEFM